MTILRNAQLGRPLRFDFLVVFQRCDQRRLGERQVLPMLHAALVNGFTLAFWISAAIMVVATLATFAVPRGVRTGH